MMKRLIKEYYYKPHLLLNHCYYVSASRLVIVLGVHLEAAVHLMSCSAAPQQSWKYAQ